MWRGSRGSPSVKYCWVTFTWRSPAPCTDETRLSRTPRSTVQVPAAAPPGRGTPSPGFEGQGAGERIGLQRHTQVELSGAPWPDTGRSQYAALAWAWAAGSGYGSPAAEGPALPSPPLRPRAPTRQPAPRSPWRGSRWSSRRCGCAGCGPQCPSPRSALQGGPARSLRLHGAAGRPALGTGAGPLHPALGSNGRSGSRSRDSARGTRLRALRSGGASRLEPWPMGARARTRSSF